jgi:hypothetical protein
MKYLLNLILLFTAITQTAIAATITTQVDRNPVGLNESFNIIFEATGSIDGDPDFSLLDKDFDIRGKSSSSNISIINGDYKKSKKWDVTAYARRAGTITIPSISFGKDSSPALILKVKKESQQPASQTADFFLETEVKPEKSWAQGQIILTLRFMSSRNLSQLQIQTPQIKSMDVVIERLGEDQQYQTQKGNKPYLVVERSYAIFPQQSGLMHIPAIIAEARIASDSRSMFDPFQRSGKTIRIQSKALDINIAGIPSNYNAKNWLPAAEIQLIEEWPQEPPIFKAGEPVTRTLTIMADGLTSAQLPELLSAAADGLKQYPDQPALKDNKKNDGIIGIRQEKIALIPTRAGQYTLPAIEIPWFNTTTGQVEKARINERIITVAAGELNTSAPQAPAIQKPVITPANPAASSTDMPSIQTSNVWFWLSLFFAAGWLLTLIIWWNKHRNEQTNKRHTQKKINTASISSADKALKKACAKNDAHSCKDALIAWGKAIYSSNPPSSLGHLAELAGDPLKSEIAKLEETLYSLNTQSWKSGDLWEITRRIKREQADKKLPPVDSLEPLYK